MKRFATTLAASVYLVAGCQTYGAGDDVPARIEEPTDLSRAALQDVVNRALGTEVLIADDALTHGSILTIEQRQPATLGNPRPQGRIMDMPIKFKLVKRGNDCVLIDTRDQQGYRLANTRCVAE